MKQISDCVYKSILIPNRYIPIIDTPEFQRLRRIKQLGLASLILPAANNTRFEHSLGAYHLADIFSKALKLPEEFKIAALLHDTGHGPFSHCSDSIIKVSHEQRAEEVIKNSSIIDIIERLNLDSSLIFNIIKGNSKYGQLLSGTLDIDRIDYLLRDSHHAGVGNININVGLLSTNVALRKNSIIINESAVSEVRNILLGRAHMFLNLYHEKDVRMVNKLVSEALSSIAPESLGQMDDIAAISAMRQSNNKIWKKLECRELPKLLHERYLKRGENIVKVSEELMAQYPAAIIDFVEAPILDTKGIRVFAGDGELKPLSKYPVYGSIKRLFGARRDYYKVCVYGGF